MSSTAVVSPARHLPPNDSLANIRHNSALASRDTYRRMREMNLSGQITRRALFAEALYDLVQAHGGQHDRVAALSAVADELGTTVDEVRHGINAAMGARLLRYSVDGLQLLAV
jgi:hypothetical protein